MCRLVLPFLALLVKAEGSEKLILLIIKITGTSEKCSNTNRNHSEGRHFGAVAHSLLHITTESLLAYKYSIHLLVQAILHHNAHPRLDHIKPGAAR